jgi:AcrR family transcriptional regulator
MAPRTEATPLRSDAARNRTAILEAARTLFGLHGLGAPLDQIARHAGLGNATLYRHFPNRCTLVAALFEETLEQVVESTERSLTDPDPWSGFESHVMFLLRLQATDRGATDVLTMTITGAPRLEDLRAKAFAGFVRITDRAKANGSLRADFEPEDIVLLLMANAGLIHRTKVAAPNAWERLAGYTLGGIRGAEHACLVPSPGEDAIKAAMAEQARLFGVQRRATGSEAQ